MSFQNTFIYLLTAFTSVMIFFLSVNKFGLKTGSFNRALRDVLRCIGSFIAFGILNYAIGTAVVFLIRGAGHFFPLYLLADPNLLIISAFQGFLFQMWWRRSRESVH